MVRKHGPLLTRMQEDYAVGVAMGKDREQAALDAGYSPHTAGVQSRQLMCKPLVEARVNELASLATGRKVMDIYRRKMRLTEIAEEDIRSDKGSPIRGPNIEAIKALNKMEGPFSRHAQSESTRPINILVADAETASILTRMAGGERREGEGSGKEHVIDLPKETNEDDD